MRLPRTNPRQRRGTLLLTVAAVGALVAFASVRAYVTDVRSEVGPLVPVLQLVRDVPQYRGVDGDAARQVLVPRRWTAPTSLSDPAALEGLVAAGPLRAGSYLQSDMLAPPPQLAPGQRATVLAVPTDAVTPDVQVGSRVDVVAALDRSRTGAKKNESRVLVNAALVLGVSRPTPGQPAGADPTASAQVRITLALSARQTTVLAWGRSMASAVSVSLVGPESPGLGKRASSYSG